MAKIKSKKVAVVILNHNGKHFAEKFIPPLLKTNYNDFEIIYVDNASNDGSLEFVRTKYPQIKTIEIKINKGFTDGYIRALSQIDADYYVLLNSDVEVTPDWISPIMKLFEKEPKLAACQPKVKSYHQKTHFEYAGAAGGYIDKLGYPFSRGRIFDTVEEDKGQYDDTREIFWATGACLFIKSDIYHQVGGLDNDFVVHMEEIDLCWRIKNQGYKIMVCPQSVVYHVGGGAMPYGSFPKIYRNFRNCLIMLLKNIPLSQLLWKLPLRLLLDQIAAWRALFLGRVHEFGAIYKAHFQFFIKLPKWLNKRKQARKFVKKKQPTGIYQKAIVVDYFLKGKKKFSQLGF